MVEFKFENKPRLGIGIYTASEISKILRVPYQKVYVWMNKYWDGDLAKNYSQKYSWQQEGTRAVSFHTFVEFYIMMILSEYGVKPKQVLNAHQELTKMYDTAYPFANKEVLERMRSDGKKVFFEDKDGIIELNGTKQFNLDIIKIFFVKLEFDKDELASKFWPIGKEKSILIDPNRRFGQPIIDGKNISPEIIYRHSKAGDPINYIAQIYGLTENQVKHSIEYCSAA